MKMFINGTNIIQKNYMNPRILVWETVNFTLRNHDYFLTSYEPVDMKMGNREYIHDNPTAP